MKIADYVVLVSPVGLPFFSVGLQELKKDPVIIGGFLKALDGFAREEIVDKNKGSSSDIRHFQWKGFSITMCNPFWEDWDLNQDDQLPLPIHLPIFATLNLSGKPHLQDPAILKGVLDYLFDNLDLKSVLEALEKTGKIPATFNRELESRVRRVIFGEVANPVPTDGLIVSVGTSWGSIFSALQLHDPKFTVFICSEQSDYIVRKISQTFGLVEKEDHEICLTDPDDTSMVAKVTADAHTRVLEKLGPNAFIILNATGGTKSLTSGVMHYGFVRHLTTCYVLSHKFREYGVDRIYGDEKLLTLDNPIQTVGFYYEKQALDAFNALNFKEADHFFSLLAQNIRDLNVATYFEGLAYLSKAYQTQKQMRYNDSVALYKKAIERFNRFCYSKHPHSTLVNSFLPRIEQQEVLVNKIAAEEPQTTFVYLCEQMNQCNRLKEEGDHYLAILQGSLIINIIFDLLLANQSLTISKKIPKKFDKNINFILAVEWKLDTLKKINHQFIQNFGSDALDESITTLKNLFPERGNGFRSIEDNLCEEALQFVNDLFNQFVEFLGTPIGLKEYEALQFIQIESPIL